MRKIIILIDFSNHAYNALSFAVELFKYKSWKIFLLHSFAEEIYGALEKTGNRENAYSFGAKIYTENREFLRQQFQEQHLQFHRIDEKYNDEGILKQIKKLNPDLLVMVNSGNTYLENILRETSIDKIGLHPKIPFLVLQNYYREI